MAGTRPASDDAAARLERLFADHERRVLAYAMRRAPTQADAEDAAVETFTIAWRKIDKVPADALPWLLAVARRVIANQRRADQRRTRLIARFGRQAATPPPATSQPDGGPLSEALGRLPANDQELLRLVAWDELDHLAISGVLGISVNAVAIRLHRARKRLRAELMKGFDPTRTSMQARGNSLNGLEDRVE